MSILWLCSLVFFTCRRQQADLVIKAPKGHQNRDGHAGEMMQADWPLDDDGTSARRNHVAAVIYIKFVFTYIMPPIQNWLYHVGIIVGLQLRTYYATVDPHPHRWHFNSHQEASFLFQDVYNSRGFVRSESRTTRHLSIRTSSEPRTARWGEPVQTAETGGHGRCSDAWGGQSEATHCQAGRVGCQAGKVGCQAGRSGCQAALGMLQ